MKWKDILKNVITQGRVKEIEDIDIDIDDDECLRWMNKLYQIVDRYPDSLFNPKQIVNEEEACRVKKNWQETHLTDYPVRRHSDLMGVNMPHVGYRNFKTGMENEKVNFTVSNTNFKGSNYAREFFISLSATTEPMDGDYHEGEKRHVVTLYTDDKETVLKIIKEVCNYLNLDDTHMIEHVNLEVV